VSKFVSKNPLERQPSSAAFLIWSAQKIPHQHQSQSLASRRTRWIQISDQPFAIDGYKVKRLNWHHFEPIYLPARLPYLNPIERLWLRLKADWFNDWIAKTSPQLQDRLIEALQYLFAQPSLIQTQCRPKTSL
jgi:hypothetical protein